MTIAAQGEIYEVVLEGKQEGQQVLNVMYFRAVTPSDSVEVRLLRALVECFVTTLVPAMNSNYEYQRCIGKRVFPDVGPLLEITSNQGDVTAGAATGDGEPTFVSALVNIHTTRGGRSGRGRMFIPGVPEGGTLGSFLNSEAPFWTALLAYVACVTTKFITSGDPPAANTWDIGVMSRKIGGAKAPFTAQGFAPATRLVAKLQLASTNSRKVGRGS